MDFFKNFYKDDDKIIGLCAFKSKKNADVKVEPKYEFGALKLVYERKIPANTFIF